MRWRRSTNLIEAAFFVTGLENTGILQRDYTEYSFMDRLLMKERNWSGYMLHIDASKPRNPLVREANDIHRALIEHATPEDPIKHAPLEIHHKAFIKEVYDPYETLFTVESIAKWFYQAKDEEKARKIDPNFSPDSKENSLPISNLKQQNRELLEENKRVNEYCKKLLLDSEQLIERLVNQDSKEPSKMKKTEYLELKTNLLSEYLPVNGKDMKILSKAFQNFTSRFEDYKVRPYHKKTVMEWLSEAYDCNDRQQFVFADILIQHFFDLK